MAIQQRINKNHCLFVVLIAIFSGVMTHLSFLSSSFRASDDNVYTYFTGIAIYQPEDAKTIHDSLISQITPQNSIDEFRYRISMRWNYTHNYLFHSSFQYFAAKVLNPVFGIGMDSYPIYLSYAMLSGALLAFASVFAVLLVGTLRYADYNSVLALAATVLTLSLLNFLPFPALNDNILDHDKSADALMHTLMFIFRTGDQNSIFSFPERSNFYLAALLVLILRSQSRYQKSYWYTVVLALLHQSLAGLFLAITIVLDLILRPEILRATQVRIAIALSSCIYIARESLWETVGTPALIITASIAIGVSILGYLIRHKSIMYRFLQKAQSLRKIYVKHTGAGADIVFVVVIWILSWPILFLLTQFMDHISTYYFWGRIHGRVWAIFFPFLIFFLFNYGFREFTLRKHGISAIIACFITALIFQVAFRWRQPSVTDVVARVAAQLTIIDGVISKQPIRTVNSEIDELYIYYAMAKSVDTGKNYTENIISTSLSPK